MSYPHAMSNPQESGKRRVPRSTPSARGSTSAADRAPAPHSTPSGPISVTPACEGVYVYTVPHSSEWTTTDLLCLLNDLVRSSSQRQTDDADDEPSSAR